MWHESCHRWVESRNSKSSAKNVQNINFYTEWEKCLLLYVSAVSKLTSFISKCRPAHKSHMIEFDGKYPKILESMNYQSQHDTITENIT